MARKNPPQSGESRLTLLVGLAIEALLESPRVTVPVPGEGTMTLRQLSQALRREALPAIDDLQALQASVISINDVLAEQDGYSQPARLDVALELHVKALQDELAKVRLTFDPDAPLRTYGQEPLSHIKELAHEVQDVTGIICGGHPRKVGALMLIAAAVPDLVGHIEEIEGSRIQ
ncbi:hypothetical protein [Pseudomonas sp. GD03730]|uniref:hypothetical protein n=1 Tax=Pseudomonas sp. GD03730 TaxID=2975375 RepID=UPI002446E4CE|nr:hypothetical protein [Pseudomonas sp. GD03730]MDH1403705.1 hypothetical protein [Pseudomonas sp. GD03730]